MDFRKCLALFLYLFLSYLQANAGTFSVDYTNHVFLKDGKPFRYISGSFHYFRVHQDLWEDRFQRIRALGLNAISTYTAWNLHEPTQGSFDFSSPDRNLSHFFTLAQQNGINILLRAGPYIDAEWEQGGLPYWLLKYDGIKMRTSDANYTKAVQNYYDKLLDVIYPFLYKNGGPILMVQIENEYGNLKACDKNYTLWLRDLFRNKLGDDVVLYTTDFIDVSCGSIPDTLTTVDFSRPDKLKEIDGYFQLQDSYSHGAPHVCSEFYSDWMLYWGQNKSELSSNNFQSPKSFVDALSYMYHKSNASMNIFVIYGGSNFGFMNSATKNAPYITSYFYGAPIADNGNITDMYTAIWSFMKNLTDWEQPPLDIPSNNPIINYGQVTLNRIGTSLISTLIQIQETCIFSTVPLSFEQIDHPYGFVLYTTNLKVSGSILSIPNIKDYGYVFINNAYMDMIERDVKETLILKANPGDVLRILVENRGRTCRSVGLSYAIPDSKGLHENVTLNGTLLQDWYQCGINLTKTSVDSLTTSFMEEHIDFDLPDKAISQPGVYIGQFNADSIEDTYFNSTGWGKGQLFINGYNIGRYWPTAGPQMTIYVPKPYIQQKNTVLLIELNGAQQNYVNFIDHPIIDFKH